MLRNLACLQPTPDNLVFPPKRGDYKYFEAPRPAPGGSEGLDDAPRSGRPPVLQPETIAQIVYKTTQETDRLSACHLEIGPLCHKVAGPEPRDGPAKISLDISELFL
jgi:hypothetical protein